MDVAIDRTLEPMIFKSSSLHNTNYAHLQAIKKSAHLCDNSQYVHIITSKDQQEAVDLIRWVFAVAAIRADSPRFSYYVSRWRVPEKIATAKKAGTFSKLIANCPPIDPSWVRFVPAALTAYRDFVAPKKPTNRRAESCHTDSSQNKLSAIAA